MRGAAGRTPWGGDGEVPEFLAPLQLAWVGGSRWPVAPGLADLCSLPLDFYHSKRRLIFSKRRP